MVVFRRTVATLAAVVILGGCGSGGDRLVPSLSAESAGSESAGAGAASGGSAEPQARAADRPEAGSRQLAQTAQTDQGPQLGDGVFEPREMPDITPTDTVVGRKVGELRRDLAEIQGEIADHNDQLQDFRRNTRAAARTYHQRVAEMSARLQVGTTPGNPELVAQWNSAQSDLGQVEQINTRMNALNTEVASTAAMAAYMLDSVQSAYGLSGALEIDHEHLARLEDTTNRTVVLIDRLTNELSEDISRQAGYLSRERQNLSTLALAVRNGEFYGDSLATRAYGQPAEPAREQAAEEYLDRRPLVVIRFDNEDVAYEQAVYDAVSQALDRRPQAAFDVLAVAPDREDRAAAALDRTKVRRLAGRVVRSLNEMGLPPNRVALASTATHTVDTNEVHIYIR